jgi:hypothetical protein
MQTGNQPPSNLLVAPQQSFLPLRLDNASLPSGQAITIANPALQFCNDRFKLLTVREQAGLLGEIAYRLQDSRKENQPISFTLKTIRAHLRTPEGGTFTREQADNYYLDYSSKALSLWLNEALEIPTERHFVIERLLDHLQTQLPAIAFTLAHIYAGGYYGLLTAREARDVHHAAQIEMISELFGFAPQAELVYYVNDHNYSKRLGGKSVSTAVKKATVLTNFANGLKEDEEGAVVAMTVGKRFDEIVFIDDEDKNLKAVMHCLIRGVYASVMDQIGMKFRTPDWEARLNERAEKLTNEAYERDGVAATQSTQFWSDLVASLTAKCLSAQTPEQASDKIIGDLILQGRWMPDVIKVHDGRKLPVEPSLAQLRKILQGDTPVVPGSRRSIVFNDIDKTILSVDALFYIRPKSAPESNPLLTFTQAEFAEHPTESHWKQQASSANGIPVDQLEFCWDHFQKANFVRRDILEAMRLGKITRNIHGH